MPSVHSGAKPMPRPAETSVAGQVVFLELFVEVPLGVGEVLAIDGDDLFRAQVVDGDFRLLRQPVGTGDANRYRSWAIEESARSRCLPPA